MTTSVPETGSTGNRTLKIIGLALLALVAVCGLAGTCLFVVLLVFGGPAQ